ncbi:hypothetical protein GCK32_010346, partial [Trichostrongylus colubriformis]
VKFRRAGLLVSYNVCVSFSYNYAPAVDSDRPLGNRQSDDYPGWGVRSELLVNIEEGSDITMSDTSVSLDFFSENLITR